MQVCSIYDSSLRFSRAVYGFLILLAFFIHNSWIILGVSILLFMSIISVKINVPYQFHAIFLRKLMKKKALPIQKESAELNFVSGMTGIIIFACFLLIYFDVFASFAWILSLIMALLIFLACFAGFCVASLTYAVYKKIFKK